MTEAGWRLVRANDDKPHRCPGCHAVMRWDLPIRGRLRRFVPYRLLQPLRMYGARRWTIYWHRPCRIIVTPLWHDHCRYDQASEVWRWPLRR